MAPLPASVAATAALLLAVVTSLVTAAHAMKHPDILPVTATYPAGNNRPLEFVEGSEQYVFQPLLSSSWTRDRKFLRQLQEPLCRPRRVLISLTPPPDAAEGSTFSPDRVEVERCAGACGTSRKACLPTAASTARVAVVLTAAPGRNRTAGYVLVQRHDACACDCATQPRHCTERQTYIAAECRCGCHPRLHAEAHRCNAQPPFIWDDDACRCGCQEAPAACASDSVWVPQLCQCRPFLPPAAERPKDSNKKTL